MPSAAGWREDPREWHCAISRAIAALFEVAFRGPAGTKRNVFDVTPDGQRFLVNTTLDNESTNNPINWVLNWTAELEQ